MPHSALQFCHATSSVCGYIFYSERDTQTATSVWAIFALNGHEKHSAISERATRATRATQCDNVATGVACVLAFLEQRQKKGRKSETAGGGVRGVSSERKTDMTFDTVTVYLAGG